MNLPALDIAVLTYKPVGIMRVCKLLLQPQDGVRYIVSWQAHENAPIPPQLIRDDVVVLRYDGVGQSANWNNAIEHCTADIILRADDDIEYTPEAFARIRKAFAENPDMDLALFGIEMNPRKPYPETMCPAWPVPKGLWVGGPEIAVRRKTAGELRAHPLLGLNAPYLQAGEDEYFVFSAVRRGLDCRYVPIVIGRHPHVSTGAKTSKGVLRAQGALITLTHPRTFVLRLPLKAWRLWRSGKSALLPSLWRLFQGALYSRKI